MSREEDGKREREGKGEEMSRRWEKRRGKREKVSREDEKRRRRKGRRGE